MHQPVLLKEVIEGLNIKTDGLYIDATAGEGGHLAEIARHQCRVLGIDVDDNQIKNLKLKVKNCVLVQGNFADIEKIAKENGFFPADGILIDLGLSMAQIENSGKGLSYKAFEEPLDMRLNNGLITTAEEIINTSDEAKLYDLLARYGEDTDSKSIAHAVMASRRIKPIRTVKELNKVIDSAVGQQDSKTYARIYQALRIAVNDELENLKKGLTGALNILGQEGRIVVITFQSLEDRITKQFILKNKLKQLNRKVIRSKNRSSYERSAKLRIIKK